MTKTFSFGEILLKFGPTGAPDEAPLRFNANHINLIVGPNNAGKSLLLRELYGANPRERNHPPMFKYNGMFARSMPATSIVAEVDWSEPISCRIQEQLVRTALAQGDPSWREIQARPWATLLDGLERAAQRLDDLRNELVSRLMNLLVTSGKLPEPAARLLPIMASQGGHDAGRSVIVIALVLLAQSRTTEAGAALESGGNALVEQPSLRQGPLSREQAASINGLLVATWEEARTVLSSLGIDTAELTTDKFLDGRSILGVLIQEVFDRSPIGLVIPRDSIPFPVPSEETVRQYKRASVLGGLLLDSKPLRLLSAQLKTDYEKTSWKNPEMRSTLCESVIYLDGLQRLEVTRSAENRPFGEQRNDVVPILSLLKQPKAMQRLRSLVASALGQHLVIDMVTQAPQLIWRLADTEPEAGLEMSFSHAANEFHSRAARLEEQSDGIHAFIGMLAAILARPSDLVFIDEPEAFLHPPLVRKLARALVSIAKELDTQFFIATHSAALLESCAAVGATVNIIRLSHDATRSTARLLDTAGLRELALDPLLRSESTLSALFHGGAVVCEAVADRVLYQEVNERLLRSGDRGGLESCVFLNAQNWQTVARMIRPLRRMGVAAAAILDSDVLFGGELTAILDAAQVPTIRRDGWLHQRGRLKECLTKRLAPRAGNGIKLKGETIAQLVQEEFEVLNALLSDMAEYGVFLVPVGELEDWFSSLGLKRTEDKSKWLRAALDRLGTDPESPNYARPTDDDVWQFIRGVNGWIRNPDRRGCAPQPAS